MSGPVARFKDTFNRLGSGSLWLLEDLYADDLFFEDPLHRIHGLPALRTYLARLYAGVIHCAFTFEHEVVAADQAMLTWTMHLAHASVGRGNPVHLPGASHIRFTDKVHYHRDYFDVGALLYERVPLLGAVIRAVKARV